MDFNKAQESFENYLNQFDKTNKKIIIKYHHTNAVVRLMEKLAKRLGLSEEEIYVAKLIGLLHDIGRFKQIETADQMSDLKTNINHAKVGCDYLFEENHIRDYITNDKYDEAIKNAILNHNCLVIAENMDEKSLLFSKMIRDMDKTDIFRVLATNYEFELIKEDVTEEVLQKFHEKELIDDVVIQTKSDDTLKYLAYIYDINFAESYELLEETDNLALFIGSLNIPRYSEDFSEEIITEVNKKLQEGIERNA